MARGKSDKLAPFQKLMTLIIGKITILYIFIDRLVTITIKRFQLFKI